jgi:threonine dehydrogenase-like Zn-dependent dehydrogenase
LLELRFFSMAPDPGFFRDVVNLPAHNVLPLPSDLSWDVGTLFEPLAVVLHSLRLAPVTLGQTAVVIGGGPIGLMTVVTLKASGAGRVWVMEPVAERRELAMAMGADAVLDPRDGDPVQQILSDTGKRGVDLAFDCAGKDTLDGLNTTNQCMRVAAHAGRVVMTAIPIGRTTPLDMHEMRRKEITFYNVRRSNHETEPAVEMMRAQPKRFGAMVTHSLPIESIQRAFEMLEQKQDGCAKIVLTF